MSTSFPTALDSFTNPTSTDTLDNPSHSDQHADANDAIEAIEQKIGLSGTSFPVSPSAGDRFYRSDRNIEYFYSGTNWLSMSLHEYILDLGVGGAIASASGNVRLPIVLPSPGGQLIQTLSSQVVFSVGAGSALSASHKWVVQMNRTPSDAALGNVIIDSGALSTTRLESSSATTNTTLSGTVFGYLLANKTGTPGNITIYSFGLSYRLIG